MRLIKASAGKSHRQQLSDSLSVIKKYSFHETMAAVSVFKNFIANRGLDGILHSMFNIEDKLQDSHVK